MKVYMTLLSVVAALLLLSPANAAKRVLYIDSYHERSAWSDGITNAIQETLQGHDDNLKIHRMDTRLKILDGKLVGDIPIIRNTQADLSINLKITKKLGLKVPKSFRELLLERLSSTICLETNLAVSRSIFRNECNDNFDTLQQNTIGCVTLKQYRGDRHPNRKFNGSRSLPAKRYCQIRTGGMVL